MTTAEQAIAVIDSEYELRLGDVHLACYQDVLAKASEVSRELAGIIKARQLSKRIGQKDFVFVEGWTTCGAMLGVAIRPVSCDENPTCEGEFVAIVEAVRTGDGFVLGRGIASCGPDERDWKSRSRQARRSMAQTRAAGKAMRLLFSWVMEMAGYAPTPFEEMDGCQNEEHPNPAVNGDAPKAEPRGKRDKPTEVSDEQLGHVWAEWWARNQDGSADLAMMRDKFAKWVMGLAKRGNWNTRRVADWKHSEYLACCSALGVPTLEELT